MPAAAGPLKKRLRQGKIIIVGVAQWKDGIWKCNARVGSECCGLWAKKYDKEHRHPMNHEKESELFIGHRSQCGKNSSDLSRGCSSGVERALCMREAEGSIPFISTNTYGTIWLVRRYFEHRRLLVQIQLCVNVLSKTEKAIQHMCPLLECGGG